MFQLTSLEEVASKNYLILFFSLMKRTCLSNEKEDEEVIRVSVSLRFWPLMELSTEII